MCGLLETRCESFRRDISVRNCTLSNSCHRKSRGYWKAQYCVTACVCSRAVSGSAAREGRGASQPAGQPAGSPGLCRSSRRPRGAGVHPQAVNGCGTWNLGGVFLKTDTELREGRCLFYFFNYHTQRPFPPAELCLYAEKSAAIAARTLLKRKQILG